MNISAKTPCRVDLAGGTLDIWPLYLFHSNAVTVNFAIDLYTTCSVETRPDAQIHLRSDDLKGEHSYPSLDALREAKDHKLPLAAEVLKFFSPASGLNLRTYSESPAGAGIGGSSALLIATCSALNKLTGAGYNIERVREIAQNIEARIIRVPTGCQDYYSAMYGGVSAIELRPDGLKRIGLEVPADELNSRVVLAIRARHATRVSTTGRSPRRISTAKKTFTGTSTRSPRLRTRCDMPCSRATGTRWRACCVRSGPIGEPTRPA
jgi:D-glycero-alpha-D-manno-heptose-7-phosphate kinase